MDTRGVFRQIAKCKAPERVPLWDVEGIAEQALRLWIKEGRLPLGAERSHLIKYDGHLVNLSFSQQPPLPAFVERTIEEDETYITYLDQNGFTVKLDKRSAVGPTNYIYLKGSVGNRREIGEMLKRFDPLDQRRFPLAWGDALIDKYNRSSSPTMVGMTWGPARGIKNGYMLGFDRFMEALVFEPELLAVIFEFWADYMIRFVSPFINKLKIDAFIFQEDGMGYRNSTLVSPEMYRRLWFPHVRKVTDFLRQHGVDLVGYYSSGNLRPLMPTLIDAGFNLFAPAECAAGMDVLELRREFGHEIFLIGGLSRESLAKGKEAIRTEVMTKVPPLMKQGRYIPAADDMIMPDMQYEDVMYFVELVKGIQIRS